jgi:hypothetical protein
MNLLFSLAAKINEQTKIVSIGVVIKVDRIKES